MTRGLDDVIREADAGQPAAVDDLFAMFYAELHRLAERQLRGGGADLTLGATTLLHETYLNLAGREGTRFPDRGRFLAYAARAMRGLIIDFARRRRAVKRGSEFVITGTGIEEAATPAVADTVELEQLDGALDELALADRALAELVDLHFFGGFTLREIAAMRGLSVRTLQRDWRKARLLLYHVMSGSDAEDVDAEA
ncbi:MAG TPA: ECF-type sigma factor [Gemmatimonadales bacterium]|nr:ECF-type sigma factor [Gemmatimonadales bacterium]